MNIKSLILTPRPLVGIFSDIIISQQVGVTHLASVALFGAYHLDNVLSAGNGALEGLLATSVFRFGFDIQLSRAQTLSQHRSLVSNIHPLYVRIQIADAFILNLPI